MRISDWSSDVCSSELFNYTAGLLYEKYGVSGRVVYTFRSRYYTADLSGQPQLRRFDPGITDEVPTLLEYVRPAGRLDFSVGYDVTDRLRFDIGGTNVLRSRTRTSRGEPFFVGNYFYRSEERRVGKEGVSPFRSRWSPYH